MAPVDVLRLAAASRAPPSWGFSKAARSTPSGLPLGQSAACLEPEGLSRGPCSSSWPRGPSASGRLLRPHPSRPSQRPSTVMDENGGMATELLGGRREEEEHSKAPGAPRRDVRPLLVRRHEPKSRETTSPVRRAKITHAQNKKCGQGRGQKGTVALWWGGGMQTGAADRKTAWRVP